MARNKHRQMILDKFNYLQEGNTKTVWVSGTQVTELFKQENPSSIRMALLLLVDEGKIVRERRRGRGGRGKTGQSAWYALAQIPPPEDLPEIDP